MSYFIDTAVNIEGNKKLRDPQIEAYYKIKDYFSVPREDRNALVVLPTGTGKSGLVSIAPFGVANKRVLIITPGLVTKDSIRKTQELLEGSFWLQHDVIFSIQDIPIVNEYTPDISDEHLNDSHIVYANIQKITGSRKSSLINRVSSDFFDFIIVDEAHHAPAQSWVDAALYFSEAKILHVTGTPYRGDGAEILGVKIHETKLSEVMRKKYVKWLRKETVNSKDLFFYTPDIPGKKLTKEEVLCFHEREWIEKSIALSKDCSAEVINHSVERWNELRKLSPRVPHKILAVGCSISHAEDIKNWYEESGLRTIIIHSRMEKAEIEQSFRLIDSHQCDVVVSVNMLMEGYDHKYLSILAIFRPYRSDNAFAQIVGRILRAIPDDEITNFSIDNNGLVIFHEEIGLNDQWGKFQSEINRVEKRQTRELDFSDREYTERASLLAEIASGEGFLSDKDSYLEDFDFNERFEEARKSIEERVRQQIETLSESLGISGEEAERFKNTLEENEARNAANDIDAILLEKRPAQARKKLREMLKNRAQDGVYNLLIDLNIDEKGTELAPVFKRHMSNVKLTYANDGILVRYVFSKLAVEFGPVDDRDNSTLLKSLDKIDDIIEEIRRML